MCVCVGGDKFSFFCAEECILCSICCQPLKEMTEGISLLNEGGSGAYLPKNI